MPAANPLSESGMGTSSALGSSTYSPQSQTASGSANVSTAVLVGGALLVILAFHLMGFRFAFDVSVGRR